MIAGNVCPISTTNLDGTMLGGLDLHNQVVNLPHVQMRYLVQHDYVGRKRCDRVNVRSVCLVMQEDTRYNNCSELFGVINVKFT